MGRNPNALCPVRMDRVNFRKQLLNWTGFYVYIWGLAAAQNRQRLSLKRLSDAAT
jgi:hypothetical protein